jgi:hypothetical protein
MGEGSCEAQIEKQFMQVNGATSGSGSVVMLLVSSRNKIR